MRKRVRTPGRPPVASHERRNDSGHHGVSWRPGGVTPSAATTATMASASKHSKLTKRASRVMAGRPTVTASPESAGTSRRRFTVASARMGTSNATLASSSPP